MADAAVQKIVSSDTSQAPQKASKGTTSESPETVQLGTTSNKPISRGDPQSGSNKTTQQTSPENPKTEKPMGKDHKDREDVDSALSDYEHVSGQEDEIKEDDERSRLKNVSVKPTLPARGKLTKTPSIREDKNRSKDQEDLTYDELQAQFKLARRENKEKLFELRELENKNALLRDAYNKLRSDLAEDPRRFSKSERTKYIEHYQVMENHIQYLAHELEKRDTHIEMLTKQTRDANSERDELDATNRKLQKHIKELSASLTECKDDLLRLQPSSQISDSEISDRYVDIAQQITSWVDDQTEDSEALEERFEKLKSTESLKLDPILDAYVDESHLRLVRHHLDALPLLIQYLVHRCLEQYVLGNGIYFYGLDIRNIAILQEAEQGMRLLEPQRDAITLRRWRSETLQGLLKSKDFAAAREQQGQTLAKTLYFALARMIRGPEMKIEDNGWEQLYKKIILPAINLATSMRLSMTDYEIVSRSLDRNGSEETVVHHNEITHYQMIDNATHKIVRPDSALKVGEDGRIGKELLTVTPALMRTKNDGIHRVVISRPTILIQLDEPMGKRTKGLKPLGSWTPSWFGGDSTVE